MSQRTLKNYTDEDLIIHDLGDIVIPADGAKDIGGDERTLMELASSDDLLSALALGVGKYQIFDGSRNLSMSQGIDMIRKITRATEVDELGRWVVRADSRKNGWDIVFQGSGDNIQTGRIGGGTPFRYDFSAPPEDPRWITQEQNPEIPDGYLCQRIDWTFSDWVYTKEGTLYFYNLPKGSFCNFSLVSPPNGIFARKKLDEYQNLITENYPAPGIEVTFARWVINYYIEGTVPMGDELNTESAAEKPAYPGLIWRADFCVPDVPNIEEAHGHFTLELYRISQDQYDIPNNYW